MQISQSIRQASSGAKRSWGKIQDRIAAADPETLRRWAIRLLTIVSIGIVYYYTIGVIWSHKIDDDLSFAIPEGELPAGGSRTVAMTTALIGREVDENSWVANDPFFMPTSMLDNMKHYQMGIVSALARFCFELTDQIGRTRGSSQADNDLQTASGLLQYDGTIWVWDPSVSWMLRAAAEEQYRAARKSLLAYNQRLGDGTAVFEKRADNLLATLDRIALDIGSSSAAIDSKIAKDSGNLIDVEADNLFYNIKGQMYAYHLILRELRTDYELVVQEKNLGTAYQQLLDSFASTAKQQPFAVMNGKTDAQLMPSHLAAQGFYLLRARTQLREITNILLK